MPKTSIKQKIYLILLGLFVSMIFLEMGLRLAGCIILSWQEHKNQIALKQKTTYRILCLGESTTAFNPLLGNGNSYPEQLQDILNRKGIGVQFSVINKGKTGVVTSVIVSSLGKYLDTYRPDMVITMMGVNDRVYNIMEYKKEGIQNIIALCNSVRIVKFTKLLYLHSINRMEELGVSFPGKQKARSPGAVDFDDDRTYIDLAWTYNYRRKQIAAKEMFEKALTINPQNVDACMGLGLYYRRIGEYDKAKKLFEKALLIDPREDMAYVELGGYYANKKDYGNTKDMFERALGINSRNPAACIGLGWYYIEMGDGCMETGKRREAQTMYEKAGEILHRVVEIEPTDDGSYVVLGWYYKKTGQYRKAKEIFKKAVTLNPRNDIAYGAIAQCCKELGEDILAEEYFRKANRLRMEYYSPVTRRNYRRLKQLVIQRGIRLVCVQYPLRSVDALRMMFDDTSGIIFVDNEKLFKDAVAQDGYDKYFEDMFGGDFGHCTREGNRLLAEHIAHVISRELFNIKIP